MFKVLKSLIFAFQLEQIVAEGESQIHHRIQNIIWIAYLFGIWTKPSLFSIRYLLEVLHNALEKWVVLLISIGLPFFAFNFCCIVFNSLN